MDVILPNLPPITKGWCIAILSTATLISANRLKLVNLLFFPDKALTTEPWRLLTSFCTFRPLSIELFLEVFYAASSCGQLESRFTTELSLFPTRIIDQFNQNHRNARDQGQGQISQLELLRSFIDRNKSIDFLYYVGQICLSIIVVACLIHYRLQFTILNLGQILSHLLIYVDSQKTPNEQINVVGLFSIKKSYYPWLVAIVTIILNTSGGLLDINNIFNSPLVWTYIVATGLGHFWWMLRDVFVSSIHYDSNDRRRLLKQKLLSRHGIMKFDIIREGLIWLLLPPWYWVILTKIKQRRA
ncbi:Der1-like family member, putative [Candida dubliniensis CD36]|uniref:ER-localized protease, putative n=1 Tax=Candida dubliniensis (strain CD36 / ATCC MYA-646 / CBS 7987 / NCPF 3949 / NRRL Y-17841) TaxID=573826 RepID=B9WHG0_CANDC|nr:Der1-like family member, putative [Candida dubliniensis CD36]CAX41602.1 Der1-like family member, putative [Candida dubliniensis CD36]